MPEAVVRRRPGDVRGTKVEDYYGCLGVPAAATEAEIRQAYRRLARRYHPDLHPGQPALEARLAEVNAAYAVLSNPARRARYDADLAAERASRARWQSTPTSPRPSPRRPDPSWVDLSGQRPARGTHVDLSGARPRPSRPSAGGPWPAAGGAHWTAARGEGWDETLDLDEELLLLLELRRLLTIFEDWEDR
jgi:curved DNA-binding protein CbpA